MKRKAPRPRTGNTGIAATDTGTEMTTTMGIEASEGGIAMSTKMTESRIDTARIGVEGMTRELDLDQGHHLRNERMSAGPGLIELETTVHHGPAPRHEEETMTIARTAEDHIQAHDVQDPIQDHDPAHALHMNAEKSDPDGTSADDLLHLTLVVATTSHTAHHQKRSLRTMLMRKLNVLGSLRLCSRTPQSWNPSAGRV